LLVSRVRDLKLFSLEFVPDLIVNFDVSEVIIGCQLSNQASYRVDYCEIGC